MDLGTKIQNARKAKGITQDQLAKAMYKSKRTIEKYESNEIDISFDTIKEICGILGTNMAELLIEDPDDVLSIIKDYYNLEDKSGYNMENDFDMLMQGFIKRYKKIGQS